MDAGFFYIAYIERKNEKDSNKQIAETLYELAWDGGAIDAGEHWEFLGSWVDNLTREHGELNKDAIMKHFFSIDAARYRASMTDSIFTLQN